MGAGDGLNGRFVMESWYDCHRQSLGFQIRCALQHAPTVGTEVGERLLRRRDIARANGAGNPPPTKGRRRHRKDRPGGRSLRGAGDGMGCGGDREVSGGHRPPLQTVSPIPCRGGLWPPVTYDHHRRRMNEI